MTRSKQAVLEDMGFIVGRRDPRRNTAFRGAYMVAEPIDPAELPTVCAGHEWCVVGDNLAELVETTFSAFALA